TRRTDGESVSRKLPTPQECRVCCLIFQGKRDLTPRVGSRSPLPPMAHYGGALVLVSPWGRGRTAALPREPGHAPHARGRPPHARGAPRRAPRLAVDDVADSRRTPL